MRNTSYLKFCTQGLIYCAPNWILELTHMSSFLIRSGRKTWRVNFCEFFMNVCEFFIMFCGLFIKFCGIFYKFYQKEKRKIVNWLFFPTSYQRNGSFQESLWCTVNKTQSAKIQILCVPHKLTSLRNSGNFILSIFMHRVQRYDSAKSCSCCLNTLYQVRQPKQAGDTT